MKKNTHVDAHYFFVHNEGDSRYDESFIKWEGYLEGKEDLFQIHYFDCIWRYTEWLSDMNILHMGNVEYIPKEEYEAAYDSMMQDSWTMPLTEDPYEDEPCEGDFHDDDLPF